MRLLREINAIIKRDQSQVALSLSDQARFIMYLTDPREEEWLAALNRSIQVRVQGIGFRVLGLG